MPQSVVKSVESWPLLNEATIEPFAENIGPFSGDLVSLVSSDVKDLMNVQLAAQQAGSKEEFEGQAEELVSEAPGKLSGYMTDQMELDKKDESKTFAWPLAFVQPIDKAFVIGDDSRFAYGWNADIEPVADGMGVTVTLFTRTAYWVKDDRDRETLIVIGRWISLSTVDPAYAATSGDYAWSMRTKVYNATVCPSVKGDPIAPDFSEGDHSEGFKMLVGLDERDYAPVEDFRRDDDDKELEEYIARCDA
ncbi:MULTISPECIES: hypothetical protein [unclassified Brevibacterium]|uniref:hypothetical protein n=1 Tax=unclassified Brevibacterium TaxID=2614124 RepID=UPI0010F8FA1D|nr:MULTISPECIES: hypothetical protein [unclassified Brevibacterium]MCM1013541.1 hypothetical protein [Brevibacterium sp. XM4083]